MGLRPFLDNTQLREGGKATKSSIAHIYKLSIPLLSSGSVTKTTAT